MPYYHFTLHKPIICMETEELYIPFDEEFISTVPADVWQKAQQGDVLAVREVFNLAADVDIYSDYIDRVWIGDLEEDNPYYADFSAEYEVVD